MIKLSEEIKVKITFTEPLLGTVPKNKEVYTTWIQSKSPRLDDDETDTIPEDMEAKGWTGFHTDDTGLFLYDYQILGFIKEAGNTLKEQLKIKNFRSKIDMYVYVEPRRIYLYQGNKIITEPAGYVERPLRAQTMQGPRVTLARSDYVPEGTTLEFTLKVIDNKDVTLDALKTVLEYGAFRGLGQFRNGGYGRFMYTIEQL